MSFVFFQGFYILCYSLPAADQLGRLVSVCGEVRGCIISLSHFRFITCSLSSDLCSYHFEVERSIGMEGSANRIHYTHVLKKGRTEEKHYGWL